MAAAAEIPRRLFGGSGRAGAPPPPQAGSNPSPAVEALGGWQPLGARTPARPRERVLALFRSPQNLAYLRGLFELEAPPGPLRRFALETLVDSVYAFEDGGGLIASDPLAQRGDARPAADLWGEVRRLNLAFFEYRMRFLRDHTPLLTGREGEAEPYHFRMLTADSLRPPGLSHLNGPGPLYAILEDQVLEGASPRENPSDGGWSRGDPHRTPERALAEYWGEGRVETATPPGSTETYIDRYGEGPHWRENFGTRFMRYPSIPIWQNLSRGREYDRDIDETLGTGPREMGNPIRRWDMDRLRQPRGEEYRRYGPRGGSTL